MWVAPVGESTSPSTAQLRWRAFPARRRIVCEYAFPLRGSLCPDHFLFCGFSFKQNFDPSLTNHIFQTKTPNELIIFLTSFKFSLVYFSIELKFLQTTFLVLFELYGDLSIFKIGI